MLVIPCFLFRSRLAYWDDSAIAVLVTTGVGVQLLSMLPPCLQYLARMLADPASAGRVIWHADSSPLAEHAGSFVAGEFPIWIAPNIRQSRGLAWLQSTAFVGGSIALGYACASRGAWLPNCEIATQAN